MSQTNAGKIFIMVLIDEIKTILYFPIWWYTSGLLNVFKLAGSIIVNMDETLGFRIWVKNLFVPMFGQRDFAGRAISLFLRLFQIIVRGLVLLLIILLALILVVIWLLLPIFVLYQAFIHIFK